MQAADYLLSKRRTPLPAWTTLLSHFRHDPQHAFAPTPSELNADRGRQKAEHWKPRGLAWDSDSEEDGDLENPPVISYEKFAKTRGRLKNFEAKHHAGTWVAMKRGAEPPCVMEYMPLYVRLGMHLVWVGGERKDRILESHQIAKLLRKESVREGLKYDSPRNPYPHIKQFVKSYKIDCSELLQPDLYSYPTFNSFFSRKLRPGARPVDAVANRALITSAADCRLTVFSDVDAAREFWVKGKNFTVSNLIQDQQLAQQLEGGEIAIFRLAPQDYHRYHSPIDAVIGPSKVIDGTYFTVNPSAVNEELDVFTMNKRRVTTMYMYAAGDPYEIAFVAIGAMLVGSINPTAFQHDEVERGDELGYFAYGGSTCILCLPKGLVKWDDDLLSNSSESLETLVKVGERIGTFL